MLFGHPLCTSDSLNLSHIFQLNFLYLLNFENWICKEIIIFPVGMISETFLLVCALSFPSIIRILYVQSVFQFSGIS